MVAFIDDDLAILSYAIADDSLSHQALNDGHIQRARRPSLPCAYRNKIGLDVALEALRDCWRKRRATMDESLAAAKVCRVANVMRPYMESLT
jgi:hypothetical protein